jgi:hypothetical protein
LNNAIAQRFGAGRAPSGVQDSGFGLRQSTRLQPAIITGTLKLNAHRDSTQLAEYRPSVRPACVGSRLLRQAQRRTHLARLRATRLRRAYCSGSEGCTWPLRRPASPFEGTTPQAPAWEEWRDEHPSLRETESGKWPPEKSGGVLLRGHRKRTLIDVSACDLWSRIEAPPGCIDLNDSASRLSNLEPFQPGSFFGSSFGLEQAQRLQRHLICGR